MAFLRVENIHKQYEGAPLLSGVSFEVTRGEVMSLLGPSGSGKTTLLRILAGLETPEAGRVWLAGEEISALPAHHRGVGLMFQAYALFPHRTVAENVAFGLRMRGADRQEIDEHVAAVLARVGLAGFGARDVGDLSGGEQQRVALARSLAPEPRLLLLDEPLGALDRNLRERLMAEMPAILRRVGVTTITVTHDQEEAFAMADRVILLHDGDVVQSGRPAEVYRRPASAWVARFLGLRNLLEARVVGPREVAASVGRLTLGAACDLPSAGTEGTLLIHPWGVQIAGPNVASDAENALTGHIQRRTFHGQLYHLTVAVEDVTLTFSHSLGDDVPAVDAEVTVTVDPAALCWLGKE